MTKITMPEPTMLERALSAIGLVTKVRHEAEINGWRARYREYINVLGKAAKEAGVKVYFSNERVDDEVIEGDAFLIGSWNAFNRLTVRPSGTLRHSPDSSWNFINCVFIESGDNEVFTEERK